MEFEWDNGNQLKSLIKHGTSKEEAEQAFNIRYILTIDSVHSSAEVRFRLIGLTDKGRILFVIFTIRKDKIRIISARSASQSERISYGANKEVKKNPQI